MTELDATVLAQEDAAHVYQRVSAGMMPQKIGRMVVTTLVARIDGFESDKASDVARVTGKKHLDAPSFVEHLMGRCLAIVHASIRHMVPEDSRALIIWLVGRGSGDHGFLHPVVEMLGESSGPEALDLVCADLYAVVARMNEADRVLFQEKIRELNRTKKEILRGFRMDAHWSLSEGDGVAARDLLVQARHLALRWLKQDRQAQAAGFEPWPQPYW